MVTEFGTKRISFHATAYTLAGVVADGGQCWIDCWDTPDRAREWAHKLFANGSWRGEQIAHVDINGRELEFRGAAWSATGNNRTFERIERTTPIAFSAEDLRKDCYPTTVMDFYEVVHERRSDGSCRCGKLPSRFAGPAA